MRVVVNEAQIKRKRQISHILFLISLAGMGIGFFYTWTSDPNSGASQISCFILPVLMLLTLTSVRMANNWIREPRPKDVLAESLKGLGKKYTVFHYLLPAPHVLVGPEGVFTLTTVWQDGNFRVTGKKWQGEGGLTKKLLGYLRQDLIGNPFTDAVFHAQQIQRLVDKIEPDSGIEVQPLVVLLSQNVTVETEDPLFPVLFADSKQRPSLRAYLKELSGKPTRTLTDAAMDKIDEMYDLLTRSEIADLLGQAADDDSDEEEAIDLAPVDAADSAHPSEEDRRASGTVFVAQAGQLFFIGVTDADPQDEITSLELQSEVSDAIEIVHTLQDTDPEKAAKRLRDKFDRKRQKEHWYGLSKKDIAWIKEQQGNVS